MTIALGILCVVLLVLLIAACARIEHLYEAERTQHGADHAVCISHVASLVSNEFSASLLERMADKWGAAEEEPNLRRLANEKYVIGGPAMPTIWLREQAALIRKGEEA